MGDIVDGIFGGGQADAAGKAAQLQSEASKEATALQREMFDRMQQNLYPYMGAGLTGLGAQMAMVGLGGAYSGSGSTPSSPALTQAQLREQLLPQFTRQGGGGSTNAFGRLADQLGYPRNGGQYVMVYDGTGNDKDTGRLMPFSSGGTASSYVDEEGLNAAIQQAMAQQQQQQAQNGIAQGVEAFQGNPALSGLGSLLTKQFEFDPSDLENTPGYQFTLQQGLKALNNQGSAQGLNMSGAQQKGLLQYATGLANQTYGDQYNRALQSYGANYGLANDMYNRLGGLSGMGQNAAAGVGQAGQNTANSISQLLQSSAQAQGSALIGGANAQAQALPNLMNMGGTAAGIYALLSDRRMKRDIERVGTTPGGHNLYRFRYLHDDKPHVGVMAQEIEQVIPDAVTEVDGIKYVDYSKVN